MRVWKFVVLPLGSLLLALAVAIPHAHAATDDAFNLITSPLPINLVAKPGTTQVADIRVKNGGTTTEKLKVTLMKFSAYGEEGKPAIADRAPGDDYFDWVSFSPQTFDAPPGEWVTVKMTIKLPTAAAFGYYYAAVFSRAGNPQPAPGKTNTLLGSTAVLVLVNADVPGAKRAANIVSFTADKRSYEFLPANFTVKLHNSGNVHLIATGNIFISRGGKAVATLKVNSAEGNILPASNRIFTASWNDGFPRYVDKQTGGKVVLDSNDKAVQTLRWDFGQTSKLRFGHYHAHLLLAYDNGQRDVPLEAEVSFWVIPWRVILLVVSVPGILLAGIIYLYITRRRIKKKLRSLSAQRPS